MERSVASPNIPLPLKKKGAKSGSKNFTAAYQDIRLSFDTRRIQRAKSPEPVESILLNATYTQELSFQPTVPVRMKPIDPEINFGDTLANRIGRMDFRKSQALMLFSISAMGLMIGILISFIL